MSGRAPFKPTPESRKTVEAMSGYGIPQDDIAAVIGCDPKTLRKYYATEIDHGAIKANTRVAESLFKIATGADQSKAVTACIFWLKCRAGWSEFAPAPTAQAPQLGKKAQANADAQRAADGTPWGELVH